MALAVICAAFAYAAFAQYVKKAPKTSGPRALGVLQLAANGKAHLIAVTIMVDGKFYDAGAYKADPVPMALQPGTVYEALKTGVSQGLFVVSGAFYDNKNGWLADGKWRSNSQIEADKAKTKAEQEKLAQKAPEVEKGPPKLKRGIPNSDETSPSPPAGKPTSETPSGDKTGSSDKKSEKGSEDSSGGGAKASGSPSSDPDRPLLRRQPAGEPPHEQTKAEPASEALTGPMQFVPAVSDAAGPEPRPYAYPMKPEEEQARLKKMLAMAGDEVKARAERIATDQQGTKPAGKNIHSTGDVRFKDVQMRVFDLSNTNEAVLVLTANASVPSAARDLVYMTVEVAREDIYGDLHKAFSETTDSQHLDALPKYELIDAVDADGDGRGELLFRMNWDNGSAFSLYRVIGDRLWLLFEGKPGS